MAEVSRMTLRMPAKFQTGRGDDVHIGPGAFALHDSVEVTEISLRHLIAGEVGVVERGDAEPRCLRAAATDCVIFRQCDPVLLRRTSNPLIVPDALVLTMGIDLEHSNHLETVRPDGVGDRVTAETAVEEEDGLRRRAPAARGHATLPRCRDRARRSRADRAHRFAYLPPRAHRRERGSALDEQMPCGAATSTTHRSSRVHQPSAGRTSAATPRRRARSCRSTFSRASPTVSTSAPATSSGRTSRCGWGCAAWPDSPTGSPRRSRRPRPSGSTRCTTTFLPPPVP